jgi:hypothetical protein
MAKKVKGPSLEKVARTYKKAHKTSSVEWSGARIHDGMGGNRGQGVTTSKLTYKPKAKAATFGGTAGGKGVTKYRKGKI